MVRLLQRTSPYRFARERMRSNRPSKTRCNERQPQTRPLVRQPRQTLEGTHRISRTWRCVKYPRTEKRASIHPSAGFFRIEPVPGLGISSTIAATSKNSPIWNGHSGCRFQHRLVPLPTMRRMLPADEWRVSTKPCPGSSMNLLWRTIAARDALPPGVRSMSLFGGYPRLSSSSLTRSITSRVRWRLFRAAIEVTPHRAS